MNGEYVNIAIYSPLSGSSYSQLPNKLRNPMKNLINIKNNDYKCFLWCHTRHLNPLKRHTKRITKADKKSLIILIKKIIARVKRKIVLALMYFVMKVILLILFIYQIKNLNVWIW